MAETTRTATTPAAGGLRDAILATLTVAISSFVIQKTGSPELADVASQAGATVASALIGIAIGLVTFGRKKLMDRLERSRS